MTGTHRLHVTLRAGGDADARARGAMDGSTLDLDVATGSASDLGRMADALTGLGIVCSVVPTRGAETPLPPGSAGAVLIVAYGLLGLAGQWTEEGTAGGPELADVVGRLLEELGG